MSSKLNDRPRARHIGLQIGRLPTGQHNAITDVDGLQVGHVSLISGEGPLAVGRGPVRTGVTAILPHSGDLYADKVCAAVHVINAFGKSVGLPQVTELGQIETPILLTNTLSVWNAADGLVDYLAQSIPDLRSVNPVVGECNDGFLNDILGRHVQPEHVFQALDGATTDAVQEGNVGAGVGMSGFGWKGGIGTASRLVDADWGSCTLGALVLTNTGEAPDLCFDGIPIGRHLLPDPSPILTPSPPGDGSIMILLATDAPLSSRQLGRIAGRSAFGLARTGGIAAHGSGDFCIAFSTGNRFSISGHQSATPSSFVPEAQLTPLFRAAVEATEEAIVNSILRAETSIGRDGNSRQAIPIPGVVDLAKSHRHTTT